MSKLFAGLSIAAAALVGIHSIADAIATTRNANFTTSGTTTHTGIVEFGTALRRAAGEYRTASAKCELITGSENNLCTAEAKSAHKRARAAARLKYRKGMPSPVKSVVNGPENLRDADAGLDVVLYRAHRQLLDPAAACFATGDIGVSFQKDKPWPRLAMK